MVALCKWNDENRIDAIKILWTPIKLYQWKKIVSSLFSNSQKVLGWCLAIQ